LTVKIGEIGNKMSKIIKKEIVNRKIVNDGIYDEFWISNVYIF